MATSKNGSLFSKVFSYNKTLLAFVAVFASGALASAEETPVVPFTKAKIKCEVVSTQTIDDPGAYGLTDKDGKPLTVGVPVTYPDLVLFKTYCFIENGSDAKVAKAVSGDAAFDTISFPDCSSSTANVCTLYKKVDKGVALTSNRALVAQVLVQNKTDATYTVTNKDIIGHTQNVSGASGNQVFDTVNWSPLDTPVYPPAKDAKCRVIVSGALDPIPEDKDYPEINVENGKLLFTATVTGVVGMGGDITAIKWSGGPDSSGLWSNPPLDIFSKVTANVTIKAGKTLTCGIQVKPSGKSYSLGLSKFGDCGFFGGLRNYYFLNKANTDFQKEGYTPPIQFPGVDVKYGTTAPDVPFRGVVNGAASIDGVINVGTNGEVVVPPVKYRKFAGAVIVARSFNKTTQAVSNAPIAWGTLDYSNYSITNLKTIANVAEDETVVFQVFLAASQITNSGDDIRGTTDKDAIPLYSFTPGTSAGKPFDYMVPFVNGSCSVMTIPVPVRADKEIGPELDGVKLCSVSKPYQLKELKSGRVSLDLMHIVPEHGTHTFPPNLLKTTTTPVTCNTADPDKRECWNLSASQLGISAQENPFISHEECRQVKTVLVDSKVCDGYGHCTVVKVPTIQIVYKPGCNVIETNECGPGMAVRFSGYNQMNLAALGCAAKYGRPGENVTATLMNQGILPYTVFGGSAPKHYTSYPKSYGDTKGYACIPCRFESDATKAGGDLVKDTAALPVDQDATSPRTPIYKFTKSTAAKSCVKDVTFEVRYFGSKACDGVNAPAGHFCSSGNIGVQNCSTKDTAMTASSPFSGGGNVAGAFRIPVCPGSGIDYDSVSVSWSPILIDVAGNGITISRNFDLARQFDIRGDGRARVLDWPLNNDEVAFLVLPNKGSVTSIKELFGDYKAKNGFESLRKLDSNRDGVINRKDKQFADLSLWFDKNRNAKVDPGELEALNINGVYELPLSYTKAGRKGAEGKTLTSVYFNHKHQRYMNVEDQYFYEYLTSGPKMSQK